MPDNAFELFMAGHPPVARLVGHANEVLWHDSALSPAVKERMRIALAEAIGCSYCARFRTDLDGKPVGDDALTPEDARKAALAARFATAVADGTATDDLTVDVQKELSTEEFADLVFSIGWFIGMQHVGRLMHWDRSCPVAPIRELVEAGRAR
jgi:alkylhydroperoxidase family enzyme